MKENKMVAESKFYPLQYVALDDNRASLLLHEGMDMKWDAFESHGFLGNGYDWQRLVGTLLEEKAPDILPALSFDSEAGMFSVSASDEAALTTLSECVRVFYDDNELMSEAIQKYAQYRSD